MISIHQPRPGSEALVVDSMHRYQTAARGQRGLNSVFTLKDQRSGALVGLAIWESEEAYEAARPILMKATEEDDFDSWEEQPMKGFRLKPI